MENLSITFKNPYTSKTISTKLQEGKLIVLVGKNGYGKTSFIQGLKDYIEKKEYLYVHWCDNDYGRDQGRQMLLMNGNMKELAGMSFHSEGETLLSSLAHFFIRKAGSLTRKAKENDTIFLLLDQADSGLDVHQINEIKNVLKEVIIKHMHSEGLKVYIVASANSYELAEGETCMNPRTGKTHKFKNFTTYKNYINRQYK